MRKIIPKLVLKNSLIRVIAPSCSGSTIKPAVLKTAELVLSKVGLQVTYSKNYLKLNEFDSSSREDRLADLHNAFSDPKVDMVLAVRGGFSANDLLDYIDWDIIRNNPKIYCGYSDNTVLQNAIFAKTGLITYSGPNFSTFGNKKGLRYTLSNFLKTVSSKSFPVRSINKVEVINKGKAVGTIIGGNLCTFNLLQGTQYMPDITNTILFLEDDHVSPLDVWEFQRNLQSVIQLKNFKKVKGIIFGKFQASSKLPPQVIRKIVQSKPELNKIPVMANLNFGHTMPIFTFPIGGTVSIDTNKPEVLNIRL